MSASGLSIFDKCIPLETEDASARGRRRGNTGKLLADNVPSGSQSTGEYSSLYAARQHVKCPVSVEKLPGANPVGRMCIVVIK